MSDQDNLGNGVVDPSILSVGEDDNGIPEFLRNQGGVSNGVEVVPVQSLPVDMQAQQVIDSLPEQEPPYDVHTALSPEAIDEATADLVSTDPVVTQSSNEAFIANAPSQIDAHSHAPNHNQQEDPAKMRKDFFRDVNAFGKASGEGASALGRLGLRALRAAADGVISTAKPQGGGKDDATLIYEAYAAMDSKHSEHTAGGSKANASKLRQIIGMGCMTTLSDPVAVGDRAVRIREQMEEQELKPKALFAALVDVSRAQQASYRELSDDEIKAACTKNVADKTLEKEWEKVRKTVEKLVSGENTAGIRDTSDTAEKIYQMVDEHCKNYKYEGDRSELVATLMERGYTRVQAEEIASK